MTVRCPCCGGTGQVQRFAPEHIRWLRQRRGLTIRAAAELAGICESYLANIEHGRQGRHGLPLGLDRLAHEWEAQAVPEGAHA